MLNGGETDPLVHSRENDHHYTMCVQRARRYRVVNARVHRRPPATNYPLWRWMSIRVFPFRSMNDCGALLQPPRVHHLQLCPLSMDEKLRGLGELGWRDPGEGNEAATRRSPPVLWRKNNLRCRNAHLNGGETIARTSGRNGTAFYIRRHHHLTITNALRRRRRVVFARGNMGGNSRGVLRSGGKISGEQARKARGPRPLSATRLPSS